MHFNTLVISMLCLCNYNLYAVHLQNKTFYFQPVLDLQLCIDRSQMYNSLVRIRTPNVNLMLAGASEFKN